MKFDSILVSAMKWSRLVVIVTVILSLQQVLVDKVAKRVFFCNGVFVRIALILM